MLAQSRPRRQLWANHAATMFCSDPQLGHWRVNGQPVAEVHDFMDGQRCSSLAFGIETRRIIAKRSRKARCSRTCINKPKRTPSVEPTAALSLPLTETRHAPIGHLAIKARWSTSTSGSNQPLRAPAGGDGRPNAGRRYSGGDDHRHELNRAKALLALATDARRLPYAHGCIYGLALALESTNSHQFGQGRRVYIWVRCHGHDHCSHGNKVSCSCSYLECDLRGVWFPVVLQNPPPLR